MLKCLDNVSLSLSVFLLCETFPVKWLGAIQLQSAVHSTRSNPSLHFRQGDDKYP